MLDRPPTTDRRGGKSVNDYGMLQGEKAVKIAAHSHIIEFGLLAILLSFVQPYVMLAGRGSGVGWSCCWPGR